MDWQAPLVNEGFWFCCSRAECVVGALAPYNHGLHLAGAGGIPALYLISRRVLTRFAALFYLLDPRLRGDDE